MSDEARQGKVEDLLRHIGNNNVAEVQAIVSKDPSIVMAYGVVGKEWRRQETMTPLQFAVSIQYLDVLRPILAVCDRANPDCIQIMAKALHDAVDQDSDRFADLLLEYGADVNVYYGYEEDSAFFAAVRKGSVHVLQVMINHGADLNMLKQNNQTVLMLAAAEGWCEMVEFLLQSGASIDLADETGLTALLHAVKQCQADLVKLLLRHGASVHIVDRDGNSVLAAAFQAHTRMTESYQYEREYYEKYGKPHGQEAPVPYTDAGLQVVKLLIAAGAPEGAQTQPGRTLLHEAVQQNNQDAVLLALVGGAATINTRQPKNGFTALHLALFNYLPPRDPDYEVTDYVAEKDCDHQCRYRPNNVHPSAKARDIAELLLDRGADINAADNSCRTALSMAIRGDDVSLVRDLLLRGACRDTGGKTAAQWGEFVKQFSSKAMLRAWQQVPGQAPSTSARVKHVVDLTTGDSDQAKNKKQRK